MLFWSSVILAWREERGRSFRAAAKRWEVMGRVVDDIGAWVCFCVWDAWLVRVYARVSDV